MMAAATRTQAQRPTREAFSASAQSSPGRLVSLVSSQLVRAVWAALEQGEIDPATAIRELQAGLPGGVAAVVPFTRHPVAAVRLAAIGAAAACGHAGVIDEVEQPARTEPLVVSEGAIEACESPCEPAALAFTLLGGFSLDRGGWCSEEPRGSGGWSSASCGFCWCIGIAA
jgi:hypothetical protein